MAAYDPYDRHVSWITEAYPATRWDAFKYRWFPDWLKRRFPVRWIESPAVRVETKG